MAKVRHRNKQTPEKAKVITYRCIGIFLAFATVVCVAAYLLQTFRFKIDAFYTSKQNDPNMHVVTETKWAQRIVLPGVPNLYKVSDDLYRGAQPTAEGMSLLQRLGVKTIINLRSLHSDRNKIGDTGLAYEHIRMTTWDPQTKDVIRFLQIVTDSSRSPVFIHCQRGADRTGTMCAIYRIAVENWSKTEAIEEMTKGGFGFFSGWQDLVDYILKLDVDKIKHSASLNE